MYKIAFLSSTNGTNFQSFLDAKARGELSDVEITCLITNKADCGAAQKARDAGIRVYFFDAREISREVFDKEVVDTLDYFEVDLVILGGFMRLFSKVMIDRYQNKIINIHPSLLPKHPGMDLAVHQEVIDDGDKETGMTIHFVDEGMDTGPIIFQKSISVEEGDTPESLRIRVQALEKEWYPKVVQMFADGKF